MEISAAHQAIQEEARKVADQFRDVAAEADEATEPHRGMQAALAQSGLAGLVVPQAYGGRQDGVDTLAVTLVREILMGVSAHLDTQFCMQGIGAMSLVRGGTEEIKQHWLPKVATMEVFAGLALTEDEAGSDLKNVSTTMVQEGDELVINGKKSWISNGRWAGFWSTLVKEGDGYSMVLIPSDAPGVSVEDTPTIIAPHLLGDITLTDVRLPVSHRLGAPGKAWSLVFATLGSFRVSVAGAAVGVAQAALDEAVAYTTKRTQFGRPLIEIGAVGQLLARSWAELEAARQFTYHAAEQAAKDPRAALDLSSMAKVVATETAGRVADNCLQTMGRAGLIRDSIVERAYRETRPMRVYEGGTEVVLDSLAKVLAKGAN